MMIVMNNVERTSVVHIHTYVPPSWIWIWYGLFSVGVTGCDTIPLYFCTTRTFQAARFENASSSQLSQFSNL